MTTDELLDVCDLKLVFLRPGIYGELKLKRKFGQGTTLILEHSPPEFPAFSESQLEVFNLPDLSGFVDSSLLNTFLNIKQEPDDTYAQTDEQLTIEYGESGSENALLKVETNTGSEEDIAASVEPLKEETPATVEPLVVNPKLPAILHNPTVLLNLHDSYSVISLKEISVQKIVHSCIKSCPPTLMELCADLISWNVDVKFPGTLQLPFSLRTAHQIAVLQRIPIRNTEHVGARSKEVFFGHLMINSIVKTYWEEQLKKRKYSVNINRLSEDKIKSWGPKTNTETWRDLDPYSSLEDIGSTSEDNKDTVPDNSDNRPNIDNLQELSGSVVTPEDTGPTLRSRLHQRKPIRHSTGRPTRKASKGAEYDEGSSSPKRKIRKLRRVHSGPSQERIAARHKRTIPPKTTHQIKINKHLKEGNRTGC